MWNWTMDIRSLKPFQRLELHHILTQPSRLLQFQLHLTSILGGVMEGGGAKEGMRRDTLRCALAGFSSVVVALSTA